LLAAVAASFLLDRVFKLESAARLVLLLAGLFALAFVAWRFLVRRLRALPGEDPLAVAVVQAVLGALTCGFLGLLARQTLGAGAGWLAGLLAALYAPAIFYESFLLKESVATFLLTASLLATMANFGRTDGSGGAAGTRWPAWVGTGALWGMATATWPLLAPVALAALIWAAIPSFTVAGDRAQGGGGAGHPRPGFDPRGFLVAGGLLCGAFLAILPCTVRNVAGEGRFVLISDSGGRNWLVGNSSNSTGTYIDFPREPLSAATFTFWRLYLRKIGLFFSAREIPQITDMALLSSASPVLSRPLPAFGFLAPLALAGLLLGFRRAWELFPLYGLAVLYPLSVSLFFVVGRFRLPLEPGLVFFAVLVLVHLRDAARLSSGRRRWARSLAVGAGVVLLAHAINRPRPLPAGAYPFHQAYARYYLDVGQRALDHDQGREALAAFGRLLDLPSRRWRAEAHAGRASAFLGPLNRPRLALDEMRRSLQVDPGQKDAARIRQVIGRLEQRVGKENSP
ncbi:MAG: hypothetical protein ACE5ID_08925, partial [Acidobacteriota bacterium]